MVHPDASSANAATHTTAFLCIPENYRPSPLHPAGEMKLFDTSIGWKLE